MLTNSQVIQILSKKKFVFDLYDKKLKDIAKNNNGMYLVDSSIITKISNDVFSAILKTKQSNATYDECVAIFNIIERDINGTKSSARRN